MGGRLSLRLPGFCIHEFRSLVGPGTVPRQVTGPAELSLNRHPGEECGGSSLKSSKNLLNYALLSTVTGASVPYRRMPHNHKAIFSRRIVWAGPAFAATTTQSPASVEQQKERESPQEGHDSEIMGNSAGLVVLLDVEGMKCGGCSATVKRILQQQPGVSSASVNLLTKIAALQVPLAIASPPCLCVFCEAVLIGHRVRTAACELQLRFSSVLSTSVPNRWILLR